MLASSYRRQGIGVIVLDPIGDNRWDADYITHDATKFVAMVQKQRNCMLFIDESGEMIGQYNDEMFFLATRARHMGHISHFLVQRPAQLNPTVRGQCTRLFLFMVASKDAKTLADEFPKAAPLIVQAPGFQKGEYVHCTKFDAGAKGQLTFPK